MDCTNPSLSKIESDACTFNKREQRLQYELNALNNKFIKLNNRQSVDLLKESQKSWNSYRESTCDVFTEIVIIDAKSKKSNEGLNDLINRGELINTARSKCFEALTEERIAFVKHFNTILK